MKTYRDAHPLEYKVIDKTMNEDDYMIGEDFLEDFVPEDIKLDDVKRLAKTVST